MKLMVARLSYWLRGLFEDPVALFKALGVESSDRILEIGCAIGYHTLPLAEIASEGKIYANDVWQGGLVYLQKQVGSDDRVEVICKSDLRDAQHREDGENDAGANQHALSYG